MSTVIDSLIVELGFDPKNFTDGQRKALDEYKKNRKRIEDENKKTGESFDVLSRRALGFLAVMVGASSIEQFVSQQVIANAVTARLAKTLDTSVGVLSAWQNIAVLTGGTAAGMASSIQGLVQQFQAFSLTGESSVVPYFRALRVNIADVKTGKMRDISDIMLDLADRFQNMDPARAAFFGHALGFDDATINVLIQGRAAVQALLDKQKQLGVVTDADAASALALQKAWGEASQSATTLGRNILTGLTPALLSLLKFSQTVTSGQLPEHVDRGDILNRFLADPVGLFDDMFFNRGPAAPAAPGRRGGAGRLGAAAAPAAGATPAQWDAYRHALAGIESGGGKYDLTGGSSGRFSGAYQLGAAEIAAAARALHEAVPSRAAFLRDPAMQERYLSAYTRLHDAELSRRSAAYRGMSTAQKLQILGYAHNQGVGGALNYLATGRAGHDAFGTSGTSYSSAIANALRATPRGGGAKSGVITGAAGLASLSAGQRSVDLSKTDTHIGTIVVQTQATDARGIARDIGAAVRRDAFASQANNGPG